MIFATSWAVSISSSCIQRTPLFISPIIAEALSFVNESIETILESLKHSLSVDNYFHHRVYSSMTVVICAFQERSKKEQERWQSDSSRSLSLLLLILLCRMVMKKHCLRISVIFVSTPTSLIRS